jgi:hypothetical protein
MVINQPNTEIQKQILRSIRDFYPIKVDEIVLVATVHKTVKDATVEQISRDIRQLRERGFIEESVVKAPFVKTETSRFKITPAGIEHLQSLEIAGPKAMVVSPGEIESRLVETYDRIKKDMEGMRQGLETSQRVLNHDMEEMNNRISEHDRVIRTYFVRVIETFGVFVGIFAVVVVAMLGSISTAASTPNVGIGTVLVILVAIPIILVIVILTLLYGIRELILKAP